MWSLLCISMHNTSWLTREDGGKEEEVEWVIGGMGGHFVATLKGFHLLNIFFSSNISCNKGFVFSVGLWEVFDSSIERTTAEGWIWQASGAKAITEAATVCFCKCNETEETKASTKVDTNGEGKCRGKKGEGALRREGGHRTAQGLSRCPTTP